METQATGTPRLARMLAFWKALPQRLGRRSVWIVAGAVGAALVALVLAALPGSPERRSAAMGEDLFEQIMAQFPDLRGSSHVAAAGAERPAQGNELLLPDAVWDHLAPEQRNSLGSWLNEMGGDWVIRVGAVAPDGKRVAGARAVVSSREWNRQLK